MKNIRWILILCCVLICTVLCTKVYVAETQKRRLKQDLIELSKIKYGLFNVDQWKHILTGIISKKIEDFNLDDTNKEKIKEKIRGFLYKVIGELENDYKDDNSGKAWFGFSLRNAASDYLGVFSKMKEDVPKITNDILSFLNDSENREHISAYLTTKINAYADNTFAEVDYSHQDAILEYYAFRTRKEALNGIAAKIRFLDQQHQIFYYSAFISILIPGLCLLFLKDLNRLELTCFLVLSLVVLTMGLLIPMIDIDARISKMSFTLLGEPVIFHDQVLYFKSKSILEVVHLMFIQGKADLFAVGILVLLFSVLFPLSKIMSALLMLYIPSVREKKWARFLVFKTGKWSMADVMVIVIFMAYIGFSGILTEQLNQLEHMNPGLDILTTNESSLQTGFYMFTAFVLLGLLISERIQNTDWMQLPPQ